MFRGKVGKIVFCYFILFVFLKKKILRENVWRKQIKVSFPPLGFRLGIYLCLDEITYGGFLLLLCIVFICSYENWKLLPQDMCSTFYVREWDLKFNRMSCELFKYYCNTMYRLCIHVSIYLYIWSQKPHNRHFTLFRHSYFFHADNERKWQNLHSYLLGKNEITNLINF